MKATNQLGRFIQTIRDGTLHHNEAALTDGQLLESYVHSREEAAFAALVHRHGPMVWGVCRCVLRSHQDAEDAFQGTFLVLVRKAASVVPRELVANWLYGVAHQTALKARATSARRMTREKQVTAMPEPVLRPQDRRDDVQVLLHQELSCLPGKYRAVIILRDLEGKTRKEVAGQLHLPEGTVASRHATARAMLAKRLARHGLPVSTVALALVLAPDAASASVPNMLESLTIKAASLFAAGRAAAEGAISARAVDLADGVLKTMLFTKLKSTTAVLVVVAALGVGTAALTQQVPADKPSGQSVQERQHLPGSPPAKTDPPGPLPENTVNAWKEAGAEVGSLRADTLGFLQFVPEKESKPGDLPAFRFVLWPEGRLAKLPVPKPAFGLSLSGTDVTDAGLKELAGLKTLQSLNLIATKVTDAGLKELAGLQSLQALQLYGTQVTDSGLKELAGLKKLQSLNLSLTGVTDAGLKDLAGLKSLQSLNLDFNKVTDAGLKDLSGLNNLQSLSLGSTKVTDAKLKELVELKRLQFLSLGSTAVTDTGLKELAGLNSLRSLDLFGTKVTGTGLKDLAGLNSLQSLNLDATQVTDAGLKHLAELKNLQSLNLYHTQISDLGLKELGGLKSLLALNLGVTQVTDAGLKELAGLKSLQSLDLRATEVTDAGLKELARLGCLQSLNLGATKVSDAGLKELVGLKNLQLLDLGFSQVTEAGRRELQKAMPGCTINR